MTLAATTSGALKAFLEGLGLSISAYRDVAPEKSKLPYLTMMEALSLTPDPLADGAGDTLTELVQVDLWQAWRDSNRKLTENSTLVRSIHIALMGALLPVAPSTVYVVLVRNVRRSLERDNNLVHHAFTLNIRRKF